MNSDYVEMWKHRLVQNMLSLFFFGFILKKKCIGLIFASVILLIYGEIGVLNYMN